MEDGSIQITLSLALTAGGAAVFAALIASAIEVLKRTFAFIKGWEVKLSFALSAAVTVAAWYDAGVRTADSVLLALIAWFAIAKLAGAVYDTAGGLVERVKGS